MSSNLATLDSRKLSTSPSLRSVAPACAATLCGAAALAWATDSSLAWSVAFAAAACFAAGWAFAARGSGRFGMGNGVTMIRVGFAAALLAPVASRADAEASWLLVAVALALLMLDGVDGWLARRRKETSTFGARFDMEADTFLLGVLTVLVLAAGRGPAIALLAPLLRPMFLVAGVVRPWLARPLPPSMRRKVLCVLPIALLVAALAPPVGELGGAILTLVALGLLAASFAIDIGWLAAGWVARRS